MQFGDTFYWHDGGHLWVVISKPELHKGVFVAVNLTTSLFRAGKDCILHAGDHKWVGRETYVSFGDAMKIGPKEEAALLKQISAGTIKTHNPFNAGPLAKIVAAAKATKAMAPDLKAYL